MNIDSLFKAITVMLILCCLCSCNKPTSRVVVTDNTDSIAEVSIVKPNALMVEMVAQEMEFFERSGHLFGVVFVKVRYYTIPVITHIKKLEPNEIGIWTTDR